MLPHHEVCPLIPSTRLQRCDTTLSESTSNKRSASRSHTGSGSGAIPLTPKRIEDPFVPIRGASAPHSSRTGRFPIFICCRDHCVGCLGCVSRGRENRHRQGFITCVACIDLIWPQREAATTIEEHNRWQVRVWYVGQHIKKRVRSKGRGKGRFWWWC